jgi:hypothetical protein
MNDDMISSLLCMWCVQDSAFCCMNCNCDTPTHKKKRNYSKKSKYMHKDTHKDIPQGIEMSRELKF